MNYYQFIMDYEIFNVFSALGLTPENFSSYAKRFCYWYNNADVKIPTPCRIVYCKDLQLISLPYLDKTVTSEHVWGIQIGDTCLCRTRTHYASSALVDYLLQDMYEDMFSVRSSEQFRMTHPHSHLQLPTENEMKRFALWHADVSETLKILGKNGIAFNMRGQYWAKKGFDIRVANVKGKAVTIGKKSSPVQTCFIRPVVHLNPQADIIGSLDDNGMPDEGWRKAEELLQS